MDRVRMSNVLRKVFFFAILIPFLNSCGLLFMKGKESKNNLFAWFAGAFGSTGTNNSSAGGAIKLVNSVETINEGQRLEFSISLESYLGKDTEITVNSSNSSLLVNGSTFSKISIPANNLNSTQTLLLEAVEDNNSENETVTIEVTAEGFSSLSF